MVAERRFAFELLLVALPFVVVGVHLTVRRLRTAGFPIGLVALFFLPVVNLGLFIVLLFAPDLPRGDAPAEPEPAPPMTPDRLHLRRRARDYDAEAAALLREQRHGFGRAAAIAWAVTVPFILLLVLLGVRVLEHYGLGVFVAAPFLLGLVSVAVFTLRGPRSFGQCMGVVFGALGLTAVALVLTASEGIVCLVMALPIGVVLALLGASVAYHFQRQCWSRRRVGALCLTLMALAPALMAAERAGEPAPRLRAVVTSVVVAAPPEVVWKRVVSFPPLPEPREWPFAAGIAAPLAAEIDGTGVGAVRHCRFTTGAFVEPIDVWEPPHLLHFNVTEQPPPMREWSPYSIHPPHLDGFLTSRAGQFRIEPRGDGRTLLEGTTWYTDRMWPADYWNVWSDALIHAIHRRVLEHVRALAEADAR